MYNSQIVKDRINSTIKSRNTSASKVLEICEFSPNLINQMSDKNGLSSFNLAKIADCLEVSVDYLLGRTDEPKMVNSHLIKTGDIGNNSSYSDTSIKISESQSKQLDETAQQLVNAFQQLDFTGKAKVMSLVAELINKVKKDKDL